MGSKRSLRDVLHLWSPPIKVKYTCVLHDAIESAIDSDPKADNIIRVRLQDILPPKPEYLNGLNWFDPSKDVKIEQRELRELLEYREALLTTEMLLSDPKYEEAIVTIDRDMIPKVKSLREVTEETIPHKKLFNLVNLIDQMDVETTVFDSVDKLKTHRYDFRSDKFLLRQGFSKLVSRLGLQEKIRKGVAITVDPPYGIFFSGPGLDAMEPQHKQVISSYLSSIIEHLPKFLDLRNTYHLYAALGHVSLGTTLGIMGFWGAGAIFETTSLSSIPEAWTAMELIQRVGPAATGLWLAYHNSVSSQERHNIALAAAFGLPFGPAVGGVLHALNVPIESTLYAPTQILSQSADTTTLGVLEVTGAPRPAAHSRWEKFKQVVKNPWVWLYGGAVALATLYNVVARYSGLFPPSLTHGVGPEGLSTDLVETLPTMLISWLQVYRKYKPLSFLNSDERMESYMSNPVEYDKLILGPHSIRIPKSAGDHTSVFNSYNNPG